MNLMDTIKQEKNRGYVIAGGAAIIAFIAFFLPYISISGYLAGGELASASGSNVGSWLWFEFLGVLLVIAVSAVFLFRSNLLGGTINMPIGQQIKYGKYLLLGSSILALLVHLLFLLSYSASGLYYEGINPAYAVVIHVSLDFGYWLFMLAAIAMVVGSVIAYRNTVPAVAQTYGQQYPPQPTQYPPYQQSYPPAEQSQQSYPPYQQPYPPAQQPQPTQYPPYQQSYPPAEQPQQQPYPPYQQSYPPVQQPPQPQQSYPPYQQPYPPAQQPQQPQQYPPTEMQPPTQQR